MQIPFLLLVIVPPRNQLAVVHNCSQCCVHERETREGCVMFLSWALIPGACPVFSRKSWTRADESVDFAGLLASCHGLLERVYGRYVGSPASSVSTPRADSGRGTAEDSWLALLREEAGQRTLVHAAVGGPRADQDVCSAEIHWQTTCCP